MGGQTKSVYLEDQDVADVERHAEKAGRSFSWALRDLLRRGLMAALISEETKHLEGMRRWTD